MIPEGHEREHPFWTYEDLALFVGATLPVLLLAALLLRFARVLAPAALSNQTVSTMVFQSIIYSLMLGALYVAISVRYGQPFWASLGWTQSYRGAYLCLFAGPPLSLGLMVLAAAVHAPAGESKIEELITGRASLITLMVFAILIGPVFEETIFRGFLFPLLERSLGVWPGIVVTAIPFALLHGPQYQWAWQQVMVVALAGVAFGYARYKTQSTTASMMVHSGYNATVFILYILQRWVFSK